MRWLPLLQAIEARLQASESVLLAIDGRSGSGKSDLASCLQMLFGASVAHMDDFFLPAARKTPQRLSQPGGNVDIERFSLEVAEPLRKGQPVCYRPYSCRTGTLGQPIPLPRAPLTVIEGVYSLHPAAGVPYTMSIFLSVPPETQRAVSYTHLDVYKRQVLGNDDRMQLAAWFDNLGKGASGAAVQCLNLMLGLPETTGLVL